MNDITRFTELSNGKGVKALLKKVANKAEQLGIITRAQEALAEGGKGNLPQDTRHANIELAINNCSVDTHLYPEAIASILPLISAALMAELLRLEEDLNDAGIYLGGSPAAPRTLPSSNPFDPGNVCRLNRKAIIGDRIVLEKDLDILDPLTIGDNHDTVGDFYAQGLQGRVMDIDEGARGGRTLRIELDRGPHTAQILREKITVRDDVISVITD